MGRAKKQRRRASRIDRGRVAPNETLRATGGRRPVFRFVALFAVVMIAYYGSSMTGVFQDVLFPAYLDATARASSTILSLLGESVRAEGSLVASSRFALEIRRGCDAIEPAALLLAAILAFPVPWRFKAIGVLVGVPTLLLLNLLRILTLYYAGVFVPRVFHVLHVEVWQPLFILLGLGVWILWVMWTLRRVGFSHAA